MWVEEQEENLEKVHERKIQPEEREDERYQELQEIIREYKDEEGSLIPILHQAQKIFGYLPREVQIFVAKSLGIPFPEVYSVVSFYSLFSMKQRGKYTIEICMGTACYVKGSEEILNKLKSELEIEPGEVTDDGKFTIETTRCMGACSLAPVVKVDENVHKHVEPDQIPDIIKEYD